MKYLIIILLVLCSCSKTKHLAKTETQTEITTNTVEKVDITIHTPKTEYKDSVKANIVHDTVKISTPENNLIIWYTPTGFLNYILTNKPKDIKILKTVTTTSKEKKKEETKEKQKEVKPLNWNYLFIILAIVIILLIIKFKS